MYRLSMRGSRKNKRVLIFFFLPVVIFGNLNFRGGGGLSGGDQLFPGAKN